MIKVEIIKNGFTLNHEDIRSFLEENLEDEDIIAFLNENYDEIKIPFLVRSARATQFFK